MFLFSLPRLIETFLILTRIQRDTVINVKTSSCKVHVISFFRILAYLCMEENQDQLFPTSFVHFVPYVVDIHEAVCECDYVSGLIIYIIY